MLILNAIKWKRRKFVTQIFLIVRLRPRARIRNTFAVNQLNVQRITSFEGPELEPYRTMRRPAEHAKQGIFVAEGDKVVQRLLESHFHVISVVLPENRLEEFRPLLEKRPEQINVYLADRKFLVTLVGIELFQGVLAVEKFPAPFRWPICYRKVLRRDCSRRWRE